MHSGDPTTEQMISSVLAYAQNRLRLDPVPSTGTAGTRPSSMPCGTGCGEEPHDPDQVLGAYASVLAPAVDLVRQILDRME